MYPLGVALLGSAIALALSFTNWRRLERLLLGFVLAVLWIAATPVFANWLNWRLASQVPEFKLAMLPTSDAVILLGGGGNILHALRIYRAGKAPRIVISGGEPAMARSIVELGAPRSAL